MENNNARKELFNETIYNNHKRLFKAFTSIAVLAFTATFIIFITGTGSQYLTLFDTICAGLLVGVILLIGFTFVNKYKYAWFSPYLSIFTVMLSLFFFSI
ncbi:MAG: hypothetical protein ACUVRK_09630 [Spirochaetota bacterium]